MTGKGIGRGVLAIFAVPAVALAASTVGSQPRPTDSFFSICCLRPTAVNSLKTR